MNMIKKYLSLTLLYSLCIVLPMYTMDGGEFKQIDSTSEPVISHEETSQEREEREAAEKKSEEDNRFRQEDIQNRAQEEARKRTESERAGFDIVDEPKESGVHLDFSKKPETTVKQIEVLKTTTSPEIKSTNFELLKKAEPKVDMRSGFKKFTDLITSKLWGDRTNVKTILENKLENSKHTAQDDELMQRLKKLSISDKEELLNELWKSQVKKYNKEIKTLNRKYANQDLTREFKINDEKAKLEKRFEPLKSAFEKFLNPREVLDVSSRNLNKKFEIITTTQAAEKISIDPNKPIEAQMIQALPEWKNFDRKAQVDIINKSLGNLRNKYQTDIAHKTITFEEAKTQLQKAFETIKTELTKSLKPGEFLSSSSISMRFDIVDTTKSLPNKTYRAPTEKMQVVNDEAEEIANIKSRKEDALKRDSKNTTLVNQAFNSLGLHPSKEYATLQEALKAVGDAARKESALALTKGNYRDRNEEKRIPLQYSNAAKILKYHFEDKFAAKK